MNSTITSNSFTDSLHFRVSNLEVPEWRAFREDYFFHFMESSIDTHAWSLTKMFVHKHNLLASGSVHSCSLLLSIKEHTNSFG